MSNRFGSVVGNLKDENMQKSMRDSFDNLETINKDFKLAMYFYNYLSGKSERLPKYEFIDKVIDMHEFNGNQQLISLGCGISVYVNNLNDHKSLFLEYVYPISDTTIRVDKIYDDSYQAYTRSISRVEDLDISEFPIFKNERVIQIQNYLKQYNNNYNNDYDTDKKTK